MACSLESVVICERDGRCRQHAGQYGEVPLEPLESRPEEADPPIETGSDQIVSTELLVLGFRRANIASKNLQLEKAPASCRVTNCKSKRGDNQPDREKSIGR
jgi:hypothetical protein